MRYVSGLFLALVIFVAGHLAPAAAHAQDRVRIGVPLFPTVSYPVFIAHERGFFDKNGIKAEIIRINSEPTTYQALISGDIDATSGAPTGLVQSNIQGLPVVSLGSWDNLVSYTMTTKEKINDLAQLKGKKIGINRLGGKSSLILRVMLEDAGLNTSKDVTLLQLGGSQERLGRAGPRRHRRGAGRFCLRAENETDGFPLGPGEKNPFYEWSDRGDRSLIEIESRQMGALCQSLPGSDALHDDQQGRFGGGLEADHANRR